MIPSTDVTLGLQHPQLWGIDNSAGEDGSEPRSRLQAGAKLISISSLDLFTRSNYQDGGRDQEVDIALAADAEATLPLLIEEVKRLITADRRRFFQARGAKLAEATAKRMEQDRVRASYGWNDSQISTARIVAELWPQIRNKDWALVSRSDAMSGWAQRLWTFDKYYQHIGQSGSVAIGYNNPASVGAALAHRKHGRWCIILNNAAAMRIWLEVFWLFAHLRFQLWTFFHTTRDTKQK